MDRPPAPHRHRSLRLPGYDYAQAGAYFVTICTQDRDCLFGEVIGDSMCPNAAGQMVADLWRELPARFPNVALDIFVVMPNHLHGVIVLQKTMRSPGPQKGPPQGSPLQIPTTGLLAIAQL
jgi:putative transposase